MPLWNTSKIVELCIDLTRGQHRVETLSPDGSYDTEVVLLTFKEDERVFLSGWDFESNNHDGFDPSNHELAHITITDGMNSNGGVCSSHEPLLVFVAKLTANLRKQGFGVHDHYDDFY